MAFYRLETSLDACAVHKGDLSTVKNLVVLLHGLGSNGQDMIGLAEVWSEELPDTLFLAPNACQPYENLYDAYQWFPLRSLDPQEMTKGLEAAEVIVNHYIDEILKKFSILRTNVMLVGFSQGAALALHVGLRRVQPAGIVSFSGGIFYEEAEVQVGRPPVLLIHGTEDEILPCDMLYMAGRYLWSKGIEPETLVCEGLGHSVNQEGLNRALSFIKKNLHVK